MKTNTQKQIKIPTRKVNKIIINYYLRENLDEIGSSLEFKNFLEKELYSAIKEAIEIGRNKAYVVTVSNLSSTVILKKEYFLTTLNLVFLEPAVATEDFDKCIEIRELIKKIK